MLKPLSIFSFDSFEYFKRVDFKIISYRLVIKYKVDLQMTKLVSLLNINEFFKKELFAPLLKN